LLPYKLPSKVILSKAVSGATEAKDKPENMDTSNSSKSLIFLIHIQGRHVNHKIMHRTISLA